MFVLWIHTVPTCRLFHSMLLVYDGETATMGGSGSHLSCKGLRTFDYSHREKEYQGHVTVELKVRDISSSVGV